MLCEHGIQIKFYLDSKSSSFTGVYVNKLDLCCGSVRGCLVNSDPAIHCLTSQTFLWNTCLQNQHHMNDAKIWYQHKQ